MKIITRNYYNSESLLSIDCYHYVSTNTSNLYDIGYCCWNTGMTTSSPYLFELAGVSKSWSSNREWSL